MAKITQTSISLELNALDSSISSDGNLNVDLTIEEAQSLYKLLKERFSDSGWIHYPTNVRDTGMPGPLWSGAYANPGGNDPLAGTTNIRGAYFTPTADTAEHDWAMEYSNMYHKLDDIAYRARGTTDVAQVLTHVQQLLKGSPKPTK